MRTATSLYSLPIPMDRKKCHEKENKRDRPVRSLALVPPLSHTGKSQTVVTSDSLDVRGPIPLTCAALRVRSVLALIFVLYNLSPINAWHAPCARSKFSSYSGFEDTTGIKLASSPKRLSRRLVMYFSNLQQGNGTRAHFPIGVTRSLGSWLKRSTLISL